MNWIKWLLSRSFFQAFMTKEVRHLATAAAGAVASWLLAHNATQSDAASIAEGVTAILVGAAGYGMSRFNASGNAAVVATAAQTGLVVPPAQARALQQQGVVAQLKVDTAQVAKVQAVIDQAEASAPETKAALLADLGGKS